MLAVYYISVEAIWIHFKKSKEKTKKKKKKKKKKEKKKKKKSQRTERRMGFGMVGIKTKQR